MADLQPPRLADVLDTHAEQIEELRGLLPPARRGRAADDLFLLRYVLSYGGASQSAAAAVVRALEWREEHAGLVAAARSCVDELDSSPLKEWIGEKTLQVIDACLLACFVGATHIPQGFPVYHIHSGRSKLRRLMDAADIDSVALWLTWRNEIGFWRCDAASRSSGLLVKQIVVMNLDGAHLSGQDPRFFMAYGKSSKRAEYLQPQLLARQIVVHPPAFMSYFWAMGKRLVSERTMRKVHVHDGPPAGHLAQYFQGEVLPEKLVAALGDAATEAEGECSQGSSTGCTSEGEAAARWASECEEAGFNAPLPAHLSQQPAPPEGL